MTLPWEVTSIDGGELTAEPYTTANHGPCVEIVARDHAGQEVSLSLSREHAVVFARRMLEHFEGVRRVA